MDEGGRLDGRYDHLLHLFSGCCAEGYLIPSPMEEAMVRIAQLELLGRIIGELDSPYEDVVD